MRSIAKKRDVPVQDMARVRGQGKARPCEAGIAAPIVYLAPQAIAKDAQRKPPPGLY
jgi:hypothetical protein